MVSSLFGLISDVLLICCNVVGISLFNMSGEEICELVLIGVKCG